MSTPYIFGEAEVTGEQEPSGEFIEDPSPDTVFIGEAEFIQPEANPGSVVDSNLDKSGDPEKPQKTTAAAGAPKLDEWMDFFSRVVLRTLCDFYVDFAFRGVDEDAVSPGDVERLKLSQEERQEIAAPLASYANKSKLMRKHGRMIIAGADSVDALIILGMWMARVQRIAKKYRPVKVKKVSNGNVPPGSNGASANGHSDGVVPPEQIRIWNPGTG
jgi:hypothetical protein